MSAYLEVIGLITRAKAEGTCRISNEENRLGELSNKENHHILFIRLNGKKKYAK